MIMLDPSQLVGLFALMELTLRSCQFFVLMPADCLESFVLDKELLFLVEGVILLSGCLLKSDFVVVVLFFETQVLQFTCLFDFGQLSCVCVAYVIDSLLLLQLALPIHILQLL